MSRSKNSRRGSRGTHRCDCERCLQIDRKEGVEAHDLDQARRALLDHGDPCPDGCCPHMPDIEAADQFNYEVMGPGNWKPSDPELPAPPPMRIKLSDAAFARLAELTENPPPAGERLRAAMKTSRSSTA